MKPAAFAARDGTKKARRDATPAEAQNQKTITTQALYRRSAPDATSAAKAASLSPPRKRRFSSLRRKASVRLKGLYRLGQFRAERGLDHDHGTFAWVLAATLACGKPCERVPIPKRFSTFRWPGLTLETLTDAVVWSCLRPFSRVDLLDIIRDVESWQDEHGVQFIRASRLGEILEVTAAERETLKLWTIDAVDEPKAARAARKAAEHRRSDRERKRKQRMERGGPRDARRLRTALAFAG
jgi:hypothetical protein